MNIYGDTGNIIALQKRAQWREIKVRIKMFTIGNKLTPGAADIFFFGGGQDQAQQLVSEDLVKSGKGEIIKQEAAKGIPFLSICGGYQLLGDYYQPHQGPRLPGVGLFPAYTVASYNRMIGNIVIQPSVISPQLSDKLVGFENHSGKTYLKKGAIPLGKVIKGFGNNGEDQTEGCVYKNSIGCYVHGSLLPKNPKLADWLLQKALEIKYQKEIHLAPLDDTLELRARQTAISRFG